jgi:DNA repair protein RadA/Sms
MTRKSDKTVFTCQNCGHSSPKWLGKCPDCGEWDTLVEEVVRSAPARPGLAPAAEVSAPVPIDAVAISDDFRLRTRIAELDRVLGGGVVPGSMVLIGGDPGIGKSTLMLQTLHGLATNGRTVLYVSGEE